MSTNYTDPYYGTSEWQKQRKRVLERDCYRCAWCGRPANTVDHLVPIRLWRARYGAAPYPDHLLVAMDRSCHGRKDGMRRY